MGSYRGDLHDRNMSNHATERMMSRLTEAERVAVRDVVNTVREAFPRGAVAVYAHRLAAHRDAECGSNGRNVVAISRDGRVSTVMLRRDNQPATADRLRVDRVLKGVF